MGRFLLKCSREPEIPRASPLLRGLLRLLDVLLENLFGDGGYGLPMGGIGLRYADIFQSRIVRP